MEIVLLVEQGEGLSATTKILGIAVQLGQKGPGRQADGDGDDTFYVSTGDSVPETNSTALGGTDLVYADVMATLYTNVENLTSTGTTAIHGTAKMDIAQFANDIAAAQLWFAQSGNNLDVTVIGTADKFTISNWYLGNQ